MSIVVQSNESERMQISIGTLSKDKNTYKKKNENENKANVCEELMLWVFVKNVGSCGHTCTYTSRYRSRILK